MSSRLRLVKREQKVDEAEEDEDPFPFDNEDSTNVEDPLAINNDDAAEVKEGKVKEEMDYGEDGRRLRSHSNGNAGKLQKVFIIVKDAPKRVGHRNCGRPRKYATREEKLKARAEQRRQSRAKMKEKEREEILRKQRERNRRRWTEMKEEAGKLKNGMAENDSNHEPNDSEKRKLNQYEELLERQRQYARRRRAENPEKYKEQKKKARQYEKKLRERNPEEFRAKANERQRKYRKNKLASQTKEKTEEEKELERTKSRLRYRKIRETAEGREMLRFRQYSRVQMQIAQMTDEELAAFKAKRREYAKKWRENLTGEKLEKYRTYLRNNAKGKYHKRLATRGEAYKAEINARYRHYVAHETPEQRQRRLRRYKINQAVTKLRKQLEEIDVPPEEVEKRVTDLRRTMEAEPLPSPETLSHYKPRVKSEVNYFTFPPRSTEGRRRGRPPGCSRRIESSSEASCDGESQPGTGSTEMDDFDDHGFQCDTTCYEDANEQVKIDANQETTTTELETVRILQFDIKCPHCPSSYSERSDLISHISSEHSEICWKCPQCKLVVLSSDELSEHYKSEHFPISKPSTETTTATPATVSKETSSNKENTFTCIKCDPVKLKSPHFESLKDLMAHVKSSHPNSFWPCSKCNILKYSESALKIHEKVCKRAKTTIKPSPRAREKRLVKKCI